MNIETLTNLFCKARINSRERKHATKEKEERAVREHLNMIYRKGPMPLNQRGPIRRAAQTIIDGLFPETRYKLSLAAIDIVRAEADNLMVRLMRTASLLAKREGRSTVYARHLRVASRLYGVAADEEDDEEKD